MITELDISNYALIDKLNIQFQKGLNILTGETGSGKSIILGALGLVLGAKANNAVVRNGEKQALIQAVFDIENCPEVRAFLEEEELYEDEDELIIARRIQATGKSSCRINGHSVALSTLKELSRYLLDVYGQHDYVSLFKQDKQLELLDRYGGDELEETKGSVKESYLIWQEALKEYEDFQSKMQDKAYREEMLAFQVRELGSAELKENEEEILEKEEYKLANAERMQGTMRDAYGILQGEGSAVLDGLYQLANDLNELQSIDDMYGAFAEKVTSWRYELEDLAHTLSRAESSLESDSQELDRVQQRIFTINGLKKKYRTSFAGLLEILEKSKKELELLKDSEMADQELAKKVKALEKDYLDKAGILTDLRKKTGDILAGRIIEELHNLNMKNVTFKINVIQNTPQKNGVDKVEFLFSSNLGEKLAGLASIASGGELSRVMLALKVILAKIDQIPVMIFDEIDTGIGGQTSQIVGEKLAGLSVDRQVLCVTHAPQIASQADTHYLIAKQVEGERTKTTIRELDKLGRIEEISRMLGDINEKTRMYAREMLRDKL